MADYAVVLTVCLARSGPRQLTTTQLAEHARLSATTVAKVLKTLVQGKLVSSVRGPTGGYRLARAAAEITVADVIAAIDGPFGVTECSRGDGLCDRSSFCTTRPHWRRINAAVAAALSSVTLADMSEPSAGRIPSPELYREGVPL